MNKRLADHAERLDLVEVMELFYSAELNISISCFWDGGWDFKIGDPLNGYREEVSFDSLPEGAKWLAKYYKDHLSK